MPKSFTKEQIQPLIEKSMFHKLMTPEIVSIDPEQRTAEFKMHMSQTLERQPGFNQWHGGAISSVVDIAACYGLAMVTGEALPTISLTVDYIRPALETDLTATAYIRKTGRSIALVDVNVEDDNGRLVAVGRASFSMLPNRTFNTGNKGR